jgi:2,3-bisphosphoglycerate-independent phosphoglycerate mutase
VRAGSDTAHLAILGFDPYQYYTGRGPFEALGIGMDVERGDICFRVNFATVDDGLRIVDRRAGRIASGTDQLAAALNGLQHDGYTFLFKESVAHRAALIIRGPGLGPFVSDADPHVEGETPHTAHGSDPASQKTADLVNWFVTKSYEILNAHPVNTARVAEGKNPANIALPRGAGGAPNLPSFEGHYGFTGAMVVEVGLVKGIGKYLGMDVIDVPEASGDINTDEIALAKAVVAGLEKHPFVLCNLKSPDVAGHDGDAMAKIKTVEKLDRLVGYVLDNVSNTYVAVTGDHSTPVLAKDHTGEPLPIALWGPCVRTDMVETFGERAASRGSLLRVTGKDVMKLLTSYNLRAEKFGA